MTAIFLFLLLQFNVVSSDVSSNHLKTPQPPVVNQDGVGDWDETD